MPQVNIKAETKQGFLEKLEGILKKMDEGLSTSAKIYEKSNKEMTEELKAKGRQNNASWLDALIIIGMTYQNDAEIKARFGRGKAEDVVENTLGTVEAAGTVEKAIEAYLAGEYPNLPEKMLMAVEEFNKQMEYYKTHPVETTGEYLNEKGEILLNGTPEEHGAFTFDIVAMMIDMALK